MIRPTYVRTPLKPEVPIKSDFNRLVRVLIKHKIRFTTQHAEPRFEIQGGHFTTQELMLLGRENKITNPDLLEVLRTKRVTSAGS